MANSEENFVFDFIKLEPLAVFISAILWKCDPHKI